MSPNDLDQLDQLDQRGRAAAADLRRRAAERPRPSVELTGRAGLAEPTPLRGARTGWHDPRRLAVAAAVVVRCWPARSGRRAGATTMTARPT
ncbi:MAG: hypothetical protein R2702_07260 [Acidimicrobiales bacterium]